MLHRAFDSWTGLGLITAGMWRHSYALTLEQQHQGGWTASFVDRDRYPLDETARVEAMPWAAVQRAAWNVMRRASWA